MSNEISINHPITAKLLSGEIELKDILNYESDFYAGRTVYKTLKEAQCTGYEAKHIVSVAKQMRDYNLVHNTNYNDREVFKKETGALNDECYRMTSFEHIISHYIKALKDPDEVSIFTYMYNYNRNKITDLEQITLEGCVEFARLREEGFKRHGDLLRGKASPFKGVSRKEQFGEDWVNPRIGEVRYTNGERDICLRPEDPVPEGFWKGGKLKGISAKELHGDDWVSPRLGEIRYTDGTRDVCLKEGDPIPEGFYKGTHITGRSLSEETRKKISISKKGQAPSNKGKIRCTNGTDYIWAEVNNIPDGYWSLIPISRFEYNRKRRERSKLAKEQKLKQEMTEKGCMNRENSKNE